ncbi:MAG: hypothetical protein JETT_2014 [Candidatus Jettenia ecosi]|uniref:Uncharacterized protein n=1 Tax=Candidatus Jettenia ecosi TaxID=2494326 RepID=A0A533QBD2_9BACT|nr:MAG: hypothetical protein JETT_2014 [Candidatus Jettenia ecosi]
MNTKNWFLWFWLISFLFVESSIVYGESSPLTTQDEIYRKAIALTEVGDNDAAFEMLKKLTYDNSKDQLRYTHVLVEQGIIMKDAKNQAWKAKAKEAAYNIKVLYRTNFNSPDYWMVYAKYAALVNRERHVYGAFKKAFFFKPDYNEGHIVKGDIYTYLAKNTEPEETIISTSITDDLTTMMETTGRDIFVRTIRGKEAKKAYETALVNQSLDNIRKAYIYYKIGELEMLIFSNKNEATRNWKKAIEIAPDSMYGKKSNELLSKNQ